MPQHTGFSVALEAEHNLWCSVPSRCDVFSHVPCIFFRVNTETSRQTKISNLQLAIGIDQQVAGLQVTVQDIGAVNVFETAQDLVDEGLEVGIG